MEEPYLYNLKEILEFELLLNHEAHFFGLVISWAPVTYSETKSQISEIYFPIRVEQCQFGEESLGLVKPHNFPR
jgi:hypothetical protein